MKKKLRAMLGNDVVDLNLAAKQSNWRRKNYLSKIFSPTEQQLVFAAENPDINVWLMWSMKEAAYKITNRKTGERTYNPLAFSCSFKINQNYAEGMVWHGNECFFTQSNLHSNFIHTVCIPKGISFRGISIIKKINLPNYIAVFNGLNTCLKLRKNKEMLPEIYNALTETSYITSISHHGTHLYIAYLKQPEVGFSKSPL